MQGLTAESDLRLSTEQSAASSAAKLEWNEKKSELEAEHQWDAGGARRWRSKRRRRRKNTSRDQWAKRENFRLYIGLFSGV